MIESGIEVTHEDGDEVRFTIIENGVQIFPKLMFPLEIKSSILNCEGGIYSKKCKAMRSCVTYKSTAILEFQG